MAHRSSDYVSGDDYVVEFLDYRYGFSRFDFEAAGHRRRGPPGTGPPTGAAAVGDGRPGRPGSHRHGRAAAQRLGTYLAVASGRDRPAAPRTGQLLAAQTGFPWGVAGPSRQNRHARCELRPGLGKLRLPHADRHIAAGRARTGAVLGGTQVPGVAAGADEHQQMRTDLNPVAVLE